MPENATMGHDSKLSGGLYLGADGQWFHDESPVRHARLSALLHRSIAWNADDALVVTTGRDVLPIVSQDAPVLVDGVRFDENGATWRLLGGRSEPHRGELFFCPDSRFRICVGRFYALVLRGPHQALQARLAEGADGGLVVTLDGPPLAVTVLDTPLNVHRPCM